MKERLFPSKIPAMPIPRRKTSIGNGKVQHQQQTVNYSASKKISKLWKSQQTAVRSNREMSITLSAKSIVLSGMPTCSGSYVYCGSTSGCPCKFFTMPDWLLTERHIVHVGSRFLVNSKNADNLLIHVLATM